MDQLGADRTPRRLRAGQCSRRLAPQLSRAKRTWCPPPASRRSPPGATSHPPRSATAWSGSVATGSVRLPRARPTSSAPCSPTAVASKAWCSQGNSSGTTIHRPARTPGWSARAGDQSLRGAPAPPAGRGALFPRAPAANTQSGGGGAGVKPVGPCLRLAIRRPPSEQICRGGRFLLHFSTVGGGQ